MNHRIKKNLDTVFERLFQIFITPTFQRCEGLNGEIPFFVQTFLANQQIEALSQIESLIKRLKNQGLEVLEINLYKICIELLEREEVLDNALATEHELSKMEFHEALNGLLSIETELIPFVKNKMQNHSFNLVFLTGIGEAYPMIRSHNILNNLHAVIKNKPLILFFPGEYNSFSLNLFGILKNENYYRALQFR